MISSQAVGSIVGMKSDEISQIAKEYLQRQAALEQETNDLKAGKVGGLQTHKRHVAALEKAINAEREKLNKVSTTLKIILFVCLSFLHYFFISKSPGYKSLLSVFILNAIKNTSYSHTPLLRTCCLLRDFANIHHPIYKIVSLC